MCAGMSLCPSRYAQALSVMPYCAPARTLQFRVSCFRPHQPQEQAGMVLHVMHNGFLCSVCIVDVRTLCIP